MNTVLKHLATGEHFNAHLSSNGLTQEQKQRRVVQVVAKLSAILAHKKPATKKEKADKHFFTTQDVMELQHLVSVDVDAAYRHATDGMQGNVRNAMVAEEPPIVHMQPVHQGTPIAMPSNPAQVSRAVPATLDFARQPAAGQMPSMTDLEQMFNRTQRRSAPFNSFQRPKS